VEQDFWLRKAEELSWAVRQLRHEVRVSIGQRSAGEASARDEDRGAGRLGRPGSEESAVAKLNIQITSGQLGSYQAAARRADLRVEEWAALVLAQAAHHQVVK
jgi:hypothetical protein